MIVVDTNIVAYFLIDGNKTAQARRLWESDPEWRMPALWRHEFLLNVLATYSRAGGATPADAQRLWQTAENLFGDAEHEIDMSAALKLAITTGISAYDAQFVTLAKTLDTKLVTEDKKLLTNFPRIAVPLKESA